MYGTSAVSGVINFISKKPKEKGVHNFTVYQLNVGHANIGGYASRKLKMIGCSMLAFVNFQEEYDVNKDDFSELPKSNNFTLHPQLFLPG